MIIWQKFCHFRSFHCHAAQSLTVHRCIILPCPSPCFELPRSLNLTSRIGRSAARPVQVSRSFHGSVWAVLEWRKLRDVLGCASVQKKIIVSWVSSQETEEAFSNFAMSKLFNMGNPLWSVTGAMTSRPYISNVGIHRKCWDKWQQKLLLTWWNHSVQVLNWGERHAKDYGTSLFDSRSITLSKDRPANTMNPSPWQK